MRGGNLTGRFTTDYEVRSIGKGITQDLQNPVGQYVRWWEFNPDRTQVDPTYDVANYWRRGRVWYIPRVVPVVLATIVQGVGGHTERGFYTIDTLRMVINTPEILDDFPSIVWEPDNHQLDRIEYRGSLFQPTMIYPKGHVSDDMVVIQVEAEQVKDEESINDTQFNGSSEYRYDFHRPFDNPPEPGFDPHEFNTSDYPQKAQFTDEFASRHFDSVERQVEKVAKLRRWGGKH